MSKQTWTAHYHKWWHLTTITSGIVYKCDCGATSEPAPWWRFWNRNPTIKEIWHK